MAKEGISQVDGSENPSPARKPLPLRIPTHPNSEQMTGILWKLATKHFKPNDWKKLAMYWGFTQEHIKTIEHEYTGRSAY